jgi:broad specificity phosphatase PhoE
MVRARQTTDILNRGSVPVETDGRLAEFKYPAEFSEKHKLRTLKSRTQHEWEYTPGPSGESFVQCGGRLISALNDIVQRPHKNVCIVSHAFIMQCAFSGLFNLKELLMFGTASVSLITFTDGKFKLGFTNQVLPRRSILACKAVSFPVRVLRGLKKRMLKK